MSLDITLAGTKIPTDASALKSLGKDEDLAFLLESRLAALLDMTLDKVPGSESSTSVAYTSPAASWCPGAGPVQFGLQGGATGTLQVVNSGSLIGYTDGLDQPQQRKIAIAAGVSYLSLTLKFNISASATGIYSSGTYGVKATLDSDDSYAIQFCKAFPPSTTMRVAITQVFEAFVLPFHMDTLSQMADGDYLLHEFEGNLHLSFGAYAGLDRVLYAGQSSIDVVKSSTSCLATIKANAKPELKAGISLDFKFSYATRFEVLLSKSENAAHLHLFRSANASASTALKAGLTIETTTTASVTGHTQALQASLVSAAGGANSESGKAVSNVVSAGASEITKYVTENADKLTSWVSKSDGIHSNLQVAIETSKTRTILAGYDFDLSSPQYPEAWKAAISCDFVQAFQTGAITLDIGSGLENDFQQKTSFACNFFNLWSMNTWDEFSSNVTLVYAGNNVFHMVAKVGRTAETQSVGSMHSLDFYFTANASVSGSGQVSHADINLHIDLTAQKDPKAAGTIASLLGAINAGPFSDALARDMRSFATNAKQGTAQLMITIPPSAYAKIQCEPYLKDKPQSTSTDRDQANWNAFSQAATDLNAWPLQQYPSLLAFAKWVELNQSATGCPRPNRIDTGDAVTKWPEDFPQISSTGTRGLIVNSMLAGQSFMNFCADLRGLVDATDTNAAGATWNDLVKKVTGAIQADAEIDFARPAALAILRLCGMQGATIAGPSATVLPASHFGVSIVLC